MFITNEDLQTLIDVEELLHNKLVQTNGIKDTYKGEEYYYFDENDEESNLFCKYNTMIEKLCEQKDKKNKINSARVAEKRKTNKFYGRSKEEKERIKRKLEKEQK